MANKIRELRLERGFTLEQVAEAVGTSVQQISRLEKGDRRLSEKWLRPISSVLGVPVAALLTDEAPNRVHLVQQPKKLRLRPDEIRLVTFWRKLSPDEKRMIAAFARDKGLEILSDQAEPRSA